MKCPIIHALTAAAVIIFSIVSMIYLECHWDGSFSVESMMINTKESQDDVIRQSWTTTLVVSASQNMGKDFE